MDVLTKIKDVQEMADKIRSSGRLIGLLPTMGYLHRGHLSLIDELKEHCDVIMMSVFINPLQFGAHEDLASYPRDLEQDKKLAEELEVDILFAPDEEEMYPPGFQTHVTVSQLPNYLCGLSRPGHFDGVATVVAKLFHIVKPHVAVFGEKDFQQILIIEKMVKDLNMDIKILRGPIIREIEGLAMSSRNANLTEKDRADANKIFHAMDFARKMIETGERDVKRVTDVIRHSIEENTNAKTDYVELVDPHSLESLERLREGTDILIAVAVFYGDVRLIDNMKFSIPVLS